MGATEGEIQAGQGATALLELLRHAQAATSRNELAFVAVNDTYALAPYRQASLWLCHGGVAAFSGVTEPDTNAPYTQFIKSLCHRLWSAPGDRLVRLVRAGDLSDNQREQWQHWLPAQLLQLRLPPRGRFRGGLLLLARDDPWSPREIALLTDWSRALGHEFASLSTGPAMPWGSASGEDAGGGRRWLSWRSPRAWLTFATLLCLWLPVRLSVLAPAELVPRDPLVVRSPLEGVVEQVLVAPNEAVTVGAPLFEFDRVSFRNELAVARRALLTTQAEYRQKSQLALMDEEGRAALAMLQGRIREQQAEIAHLEELEQRGVVESPGEGIAIFDSASEWRGRPVVIGERVMEIADERSAELEAWVAPADMIPLADDARITFYMNADPLKPLDAELRYLAHEARERPDGTFAYRARAVLVELPASARIGLKGTAKLRGDRVSLIYWLVRRPWAALRGWLGV